jgi:thiamine biosynthesis lipoprotein
VIGTLHLGSNQGTLAARSFRAIGTTATVVVADCAQAEAAQSILRAELEAIDLACSRFRPDSEIESVHNQSGRSTVVSPLLFEALEVALQVAEMTRGAVDLTVGNAMSALGYDRDFAQIAPLPALPSGVLGPVVGYGHVHLNPRTRSVRIPKGVRLDLGSTAKAFVADRGASRIANQLGCGVLVSIGGDVAVAGPAPQEGWAIGIAADSSTAPSEVEHVVAIRSGGLASSSTDVRTWCVGGERVHHIVDPATGYSAPAYWKLVSATGSNCVTANALTTASIVWGERALAHLAVFDQAVRLVRHDEVVVSLGGGPDNSAP